MRITVRDNKIHMPHNWVGGYRKGPDYPWHHSAPISEELLEKAVDESETVQDFDHRMKMMITVMIYDDWWNRVRM